MGNWVVRTIPCDYDNKTEGIGLDGNGCGSGRLLCCIEMQRLNPFVLPAAQVSGWTFTCAHFIRLVIPYPVPELANVGNLSI